MKKPTEDEIRVIITIFRLDPYYWVNSKEIYCSATVGSQGKAGEGGSYCTRAPKHEGPHICTVHYNARLRDAGYYIKPELRYIWYD